MGVGIIVAARTIAAITAHCGADFAELRHYSEILLMLSHLGFLANVVRIDSFGLCATGDDRLAGRGVFYVYGATEAQREAITSTLPAIVIDLESADDVAYVLAARDELLCTYGVEPMTIYGEDRTRTRVDDRLTSCGD